MYLYKDLKIQVAAENLLDAHYKTFASGISSPGRNLMASVYFNF
jgi:hemoglobin/transferrin/lactoferrin receptor protein